MKKNLSLVIIFAALCLAGQGQYHKAGFFSSKGRTIGVGSTSFIMGDGKGAPIGFFYEGSRESTERRIFTYGNISVIPGYKFSYQTPSTDQASEKDITVSGKTTMHFVYAFNVGYFLLSEKNGERKFKPFVSAGFNVLLAGRLKEVNYSDGSYGDNVTKDVSGETFSTGFRGAAGCIYSLSQRFSLKLDGGYTYQFNLNPSSMESIQTYKLFTSHASVSLGIRYDIFRKE